jgi:YVTN family beta-propeller protein
MSMTGDDGGAPPFAVNCTAAAPSADALVKAGKQQDGSVVLPGGRRISPAGTLIDVGGFPLAMRMLAGDRYVIVTDGDYGDEALRIVDLQAADPHNAIVSKYDYIRSTDDSHAPNLFYGMALTADGKRLYVSNGGYDPVPDNMPQAAHYNTIDVFDIAGSPPQLTRNDALTLRLYFNTATGSVQFRLPSGMQLSSDEKLLYVASQNDGTLAILDVSAGQTYGTEIGRATIPGINPYDVAVDEASHTAFVSLWGGLKTSPGKYVDGIVTVDVTDPTKPMAAAAPLPTGKAAEAELLLGGKLYVTNADSDTLSIVDVASKSVKSSPVSAGALLGASPNQMAIDQASNRIYVANANENSVAVFDLATMMPKGRIPTAWYPTAVGLLSDGTVVIASAKGLGMGPTNMTPDRNGYMKGTLLVVKKPSDSDLMASDKIVADNLARPRSYQTPLTCPSDGEKRFPIPADDKSPSPIKHVFLIVRENKTYDAVLGDLAGANGDASLTLFGNDVTPNAHALARTFTNLDNFYSQAEQSLQGHEWTTAAFSNDYTEKAWNCTWGRAYRPAGAFASGLYEHLAVPGTDTIWKHFDAVGMAYHNYGEVVNTDGVLHVYDVGYPGVFFDLDTKDVVKMDFIISQLTDLSLGLEPFTYISLPNDHTYGTATGKPTPQSMVADNDEATGRFIDALSHSEYWASSLVFIIEDDPSDGGDHVEGHRSLCLVISPWVKRGYVSSVHYDVPAIWRTINLTLGVSPMNLYDGNAAAMYDLFAQQPDLTPYVFIPKTVPDGLNGADAPLAEDSNKIDFSQPDTAPLGQILWRAIKGVDPPWGAMPSPRGFHPHDDDD